MSHAFAILGKKCDPPMLTHADGSMTGFLSTTPTTTPCCNKICALNEIDCTPTLLVSMVPAALVVLHSADP